MIRTAIIGYGTWAERHHALMLKANREFELVAVCDPNPERRAAAEEAHGVETFGLPYDLLEWDYEHGERGFSLAVVTTPPSDHYGPSALCLTCEKAVVIEKPMALCREECDLLIGLAAEHGQMLTVYHERRWDALHLQAMRAVPAVEPLSLVELRDYSWTNEAAARAYAQAPWRLDNPREGGRLYDLGVHQIDQALQLSGITPTAVFAHVDAHRFEANDHYEVTIIGESGDPVVRVSGSGCSLVGQQGVYLCGDNGAYADGELRTTKGDKELPEGKSTPAALYANIADHLLRGAPLEVLPEQAATVVAICEAAVHSSETGDVVSL